MKTFWTDIWQKDGGGGDIPQGPSGPKEMEESSEKQILQGRPANSTNGTGLEPGMVGDYTKAG